MTKKVFLFFLTTLIFAGCKKESTPPPPPPATNTQDTIPPVITIKGNIADSSILNSTYIDSGATAFDSNDGDVTGSIILSGTVNKDLTGTYTLTYTASDAAGNTSSKTRTVTIFNQAASWMGTYLKTNIVDSTFGDPAHTNFIATYSWTHNCLLIASTTQNNAIIIDPFMDYNNISSSQKVKGTVNGTTMTIPSQTTNSIGSNSHDHTFQGTATLISTNPTNKIRFITSDHDITINAYAYDIWTITY